MSQKALYRKYRSTSFDEVLGQDHITNTLQKAIKAGNFGHAYLFTGPRGVGKTSVARLLAHAIIEQNYAGDSLEHLDIIEIDAASNTGVDDVRELREKAYVAPAAASHKIYIIDEVHMLSKAAFNALLKILEEPPEHVIFILATTEAHKIPATVASRTQRFGFRPIPQELLASHIQSIAKKEKVKLNDDAAKLIAEHGSGSFRDAISLLDQLQNANKTIDTSTIRQTLGQLDEHVLDEITQAVTKGDIGQIISTIESAERDGAQPVEIAQQLASHWRHELLRGNVPLGRTKTLQAIEDLLAVRASMHPRLLLEVVLIRYCEAADEQQVPVQKKVDTIQEQPKTPEPTPKKESPEPQQKQRPKKPVVSGTAEPIDESQWSQILTRVKTTNNPLYALLRMSHMETTSGVLKLRFGFPFHHRQMQDKKNQEILLNAINEEFGFVPELHLEVDEATKQPLPEIKNPADDVISVLGGEAVSI